MRSYILWLVVQTFHVCIPLELGQGPSSPGGLSIPSICSKICSTDTSVCDRFSNTSSKKNGFSMENSLSLSMANAFMPCLSIGSHASLASFLLLMCLKKNLLLLYMSLQVFSQNLLWHNFTFNLPVLVALSDTHTWTGLQLYEGSLLVLDNFPLPSV